MSNQFERDWRLHNPIAYAALLEMQEGRCAICEQILVEPQVDHNHGNGEVRGLLCLKCNFGLGLFADDPEVLDRAAKYLRLARADQSST